MAPKQLLTIGEEGFWAPGGGANPQGPGSWAEREGQDFVRDHASPAIDFMAIHLWPDNWKDDSEGFIRSWLRDHAAAAKAAGKPVRVRDGGVAWRQGGVKAVPRAGGGGALRPRSGHPRVLAPAPAPPALPHPAPLQLLLEEYGAWYKQDSDRAKRVAWFKLIADEVAASASSGGALRGALSVYSPERLIARTSPRRHAAMRRWAQAQPAQPAMAEPWLRRAAALQRRA